MLDATGTIEMLKRKSDGAGGRGCTRRQVEERINHDQEFQGEKR